MMAREELEQMEVVALVDRLTAKEIQRVIRILNAEFTSRQRSCTPELTLEKYDYECPCCSQNDSEKSQPSLKKIEINLRCGSVRIVACHGYYRIYLIGKNNEKILVESGKRGSMYKLLSIIEKLNQN